MKPIILDTSVLVAIFMETEENHQHAKKLGDYLVDKNIFLKKGQLKSTRYYLNL